MKKMILLFILCFGLALPCFAADGASFDPTKISVQSVGASIPVGTVITWPSNSWPSDKDNWLECNGQAISSTVYPELVAVVGDHVPDYRGIFLRGYGSQVSTHYGTVAHSSAGLGQLQGDAIREIWGSYPELISPGASSEYGAMAYGASWSDGGHAINKTDGWRKRSADFYASRVAPVAEENRPVNRAVRYFIRAR